MVVLIYPYGGSNSKESACNVRDAGSIPGSGRFPGEGNGNPLQYSCLEKSPEDPGRLQTMGLQRVGHSWATNTSHTMEHYSTIKRKKILIYSTTWMDIKIFCWMRKVGQRKCMQYDFIDIKQTDLLWQKSDQCLSKAGVSRGIDDKEKTLEGMEVSIIWIVVMVSKMEAYVMMQLLYLLYFIVCWLYFNKTVWLNTNIKISCST